MKVRLFPLYQFIRIQCNKLHKFIVVEKKKQFKNVYILIISIFKIVVTNTSDGNLLIASATSLTVFSIKRELAYRTFESQKCLGLYYIDISNMYIPI